MAGGKIAVDAGAHVDRAFDGDIQFERIKCAGRGHRPLYIRSGDSLRGS